MSSSGRETRSPEQHGIVLSRSPHPYRRKSISLRVEHPTDSSTETSLPGFRHTSDSSEDHAAEADDEKGPLLRLPAPPLRPQKGLKGVRDPSIQASPAPSPLPSPYKQLGRFVTDEQVHALRAPATAQEEAETIGKYRRTRHAEVVRRMSEALLLLAILVLQTFRTRINFRDEARALKPEILAWFTGLSTACLFLPIRRSWALYRRSSAGLYSAVKVGFHVPSHFDSGKILYPTLLPLLIVGSLEAHGLPIPANLVLSLSSLPAALFPCRLPHVQWAVSLLPITAISPLSEPISMLKLAEELSLLPALHENLTKAIAHTTAASLDQAELHLMSVGLVNLLLCASSPQAQILKALLWVGGLSVYVSCESALQAEVALARIPAWRFARNRPQRKGLVGRFNRILRAVVPESQSRFAAIASSDDEGDTSSMLYAPRSRQRGMNRPDRTASADERSDQSLADSSKVARSSTFSTFGRAAQVAIKWRHIANTSNPYRRLNYLHAQAAKLSIALYVYTALTTIILIPVRHYIDTRALGKHEAIGWALGYFFGDVAPVRLFVVSNNLERWIVLPLHRHSIAGTPSHGWVDNVRIRVLGAANARLVLAAYCVVVVAMGIAVVVRLQKVVEVDTRRKVFHGVMVAMLVPTIPVDPCFFALALMIVLAIFLMLDMIRASQLPPISRPLTTFLAPYVDGRDHRGPVVVSHIFLLVGCAIPLWLSLASTSRTGAGPLAGWEMETRDVSMVSGVICVGMGDAAASLVGRRYGRTKWYWGGGKSLEGSAAFALAVTVGLLMSWLWLRLGGWMELRTPDVLLACLKSAAAGMGASLMESTLTAANDNVVVPIGLWLLVRALNI